MSLQFSDTTNKSGIIQKIEQNLGLDDGAISGNTFLMAKFTSQVNLKASALWGKIFAAAGWRWQHDDTNSTTTEGYPTVFANLTSGTRSYAITVDSASNLVVDIYKVFVMNTAGIYQEVYPIDVQSEGAKFNSFIDGQTYSGVPTWYEKTGKYITFDVTPNYTQANGIKIIVNREGVSFTVSDTSAKPGFWPLGHEYLPLAVSYDEACIKTLSNKDDLLNKRDEVLSDILTYYGIRGRDESKVMEGKKFNFR